MHRWPWAAAGSDDGPPLILIALSGVVALAVVFPLTWLVIAGLSVDPLRAWDLATRVATQRVILNSLVLMGAVTAGAILLGVPLAFLTVLTDLPYRRFWTVLVALPLVVPSYVGAFAVISAFGPFGRFQDVLAPVGIGDVPQIYGLPGSILVITLYTYPYVYLTTRASLIAFDKRLLDVARTLDHGQLQAIWRVAIPQVRPAIAAGALLAALYAISDFGTPAIMRLPVFTRQIYVELRTFGQDYAAVLSIELLLIVLLVLLLERVVRPSGSSASEVRRASGRTISLGRWRWPATLLPAGVAIAALGIPLWILLAWLIDPGTAQRPALAFEWGFAVNSVLIAVAAAVVAAGVAIPVAYLVGRYELGVAALFERATYLGFAVPGVVLGFALVFFGANYATWLYLTLPLLVFAYVVRFLPQAVGSIHSTTLQVDATLLEAADTLGAYRWETFRKVTLPLIAPGVLAGGALVFLTTMKELPITLLLRPHGFETIVTQIWRAQEQGFYQYAAIPALLLILISGISMLVLLSQEAERAT